MAYEPKPGDGALFANQNRNSDNAPNATGYVVAHRDIKAGERLRLAAWTKGGGDRGKFQSLKLSDERQRDTPVMDNGQQGRDIDDDIPF